MEEKNIQQVQTGQPKKRYEIWIIVSVVLAMIVLMSIAKIMIASSITNQASDTVQTFLFTQVGIPLVNLNQPPVNITNLDEAKSKLDSDEAFVYSQFNELKLNGKMLVAIPNQTITCGDGTIISPEQSYKGVRCNYSAEGKITSSGEGFIYVNSNGTKAVREIWSYSIVSTLRKYSYYVLQIMDEEPKTTATIFAQGLDELLYITEVTLEASALLNVLTKSPMTNVTDASVALKNIENINDNLEMPTAEQINNLDLKSGCVGSDLSNPTGQLKTITGNGKPNNGWDYGSLIEKIFFLNPSQSKICANLERYHKKNALKILEEAQTTQNPFIAIQDKLHLNFLVKCSSELFPTKDSSNACRKNYVKEFNAKFNITE